MVYYFSILLNLFLVLLFGFGANDTFIEFSLNENVISIMNFIFIFAISIFLTSLISLISLMIKWKKTIFVLNLNYILIFIFFTTGLIKMFIESSFSEVKYDLMKLVIIFFSIVFFIYITNYFKFNYDSILEIDDIGNNKIN